MGSKALQLQDFALKIFKFSCWSMNGRLHGPPFFHASTFIWDQLFLCPSVKGGRDVLDTTLCDKVCQ
jgi:hypothetical protein